MKTQKLASGLTIRLFDAPPVSFRFDKASDDEKARYGLARKRGIPEELQARLDGRAERSRFVTPRFRPRKTRRLSLPGLRSDHAPEQTSTWSGAVTFPAAGDHLCWVEGQWATPVAGLPAGAVDGTQYCASAWVGLDGDDGSNDVLQAGCDSDVSLSAGATTVTYAPWWEWYPTGSQWITNMPVSAGDVMSCVIVLTTGSTTSASINLTNETTNVALTFEAVAGAGVSLAGNCAEWIVEAFGSLGPLARFGQVEFSNCNAGAMSGATVTAGAGTTIEMVDAAGNVISSGAIQAPTQVQVSYA